MGRLSRRIIVTSQWTRVTQCIMHWVFFLEVGREQTYKGNHGLGHLPEGTL